MLSQGEALGKAVVGMACVLAEAFDDPRALAAALVHPNGETSPMVIDVKAVRELTSAIKDLTGALEASGGMDGVPCGVVILPQAEAERSAADTFRMAGREHPGGDAMNHDAATTGGAEAMNAEPMNADPAYAEASDADPACAEASDADPAYAEPTDADPPDAE